MVGNAPRPVGAGFIAAVVLVVVSASGLAGCDVSVTPHAAPSSSAKPSPTPARTVAIGKKVDVQRPGFRLTATLRPKDDAADELASEAFYFELAVTVKSGSFVFFPSMLKWYGSKDKPSHPADVRGVDGSGSTLMVAGATERYLVSVPNPANGPNGRLILVLYEQGGTPLAVWSG